MAAIACGGETLKVGKLAPSMASAGRVLDRVGHESRVWVAELSLPPHHARAAA